MLVLNIRKFEKSRSKFQCSTKGRKRLLSQVIGGFAKLESLRNQIDYVALTGGYFIFVVHTA